MSDLTRDEIRQACEAVGWEWNERRKPVGEETLQRDFDHAWEMVGSVKALRFHPAYDSEERDALALLEAWRHVGIRAHFYRIVSPLGEKGTFEVSLMHRTLSNEGSGSTLPAAAVRAVLSWARSAKS